MRDANDKTIERAFARLLAGERASAEAAMTDCLREAVRHALEAHDGRHRRHLESGDTYGWLLVHDGAAVRMEVTSGGEAIGDVTARLLRMEGRVRRTGWVGVVMAGMNPASFFSLDYEMDVMHDTAAMTARTFAQRFRRL